MSTNLIKPRKALNKAFLKVKPKRTEIEYFKKNLSTLLDRINDNESEEYHKNLVSEFLKDTYYKQNHFINTKGRNDLVIHNGSQATSSVGVIIEAKKPTNRSEMIYKDKINVKAFHELVLYYLRERITHKNIEIKHLIVTNINEWYIFDATMFDRLFAQNKNLVKQFNEFESGRLADTKTEFFYKNIAEPFISDLNQDIEVTYFNIRNFEKPLRNCARKDDKELIVLFKLFSPEHQLKLPFANDSNSLDKRFYSELLHIIGLNETKVGKKKVIGRNPEGKRHLGSLIENTIIQLDSLDKISRILNPTRYGSNPQERLYNIALELSITWINRILFLKLLEGQLISYHRDDKSYEFLNINRIKNFDDLNSLFFQVLARKSDERTDDVKAIFSKVPYLNSSLFEPTEIEHNTLFISNLRDDRTIPVFTQTVLKDEKGKRINGEISTIDYLLKFLSAYDFSSEGGEDIQEDNKTLINASVLGLIFEKINGYKDGSYFTPGFITMYICRETIRQAVVQKFNEVKGWKCNDIETLYNKIDDPAEANMIINDIKICDPAVGSGHFLVSALNEIIAVKNDLKILHDRDGKRLKEYHFEVVNDELIVTDEDGDLFKYNPKTKESQRIQETLFHEKQTIIENCLFGVDINPNSVKICRLRLWIELLKNAYYKNDSELETLPNIDINIKCGNSLVSRFSLDSDLKAALKKSASKWSIDSYRTAVANYRIAENKDQKHTMERLIEEIKYNFQSEISQNDPKYKKIRKLRGDLYHLNYQGHLFEMSLKEKKNINKKLATLTDELKKLESEIEVIKNNKIYENAFEWRFEFPEVLNDDGDFVGFDAVIGNPPYVLVQTLGDQNLFDYYNKTYKTATYKIDTYALFYELGINIISEKSILSFITPNTFLKNEHSRNLRELILSNSILEIINFYTKVFEDASVDTLILILLKKRNISNQFIFSEYRNFIPDLNKTQKIPHLQIKFDKDDLKFELDIDANQGEILRKIEKDTYPLKKYGRAYFGIQTYDRNKYVCNDKLSNLHFPVIDGANINRYIYKPSSEYVNLTKSSIKSGGDPTVYKRHRIVIRQIGKYPEGTIIEPGLFTLNTIYNIYLNFDNCQLLRYLLALINSKLLQFYWMKKHYDNKSTFPKIKKIPIESLPIKEPDSESLNKLSLLVEMILEQKQKEIDTTELENQVDAIVYELYGLNKNEIYIIEQTKNPEMA